jgi:hypothetical protein
MQATIPHLNSLVKSLPSNNKTLITMIDQLIKLVQENAGDAIVKNKAIPDQHNAAAINEVGTQLFNGLQDQAKHGNLEQIVSMFKSGGTSNLTNNPVVSQLVSKVAASLGSKFGVSPQAAQQIATTLLPTVLSKFVNKTNDPNDNDFNLQDVMKNFGGGNVGDILSQFGGSSSSKGGGLGDTIGKMFN